MKRTLLPAVLTVCLLIAAAFGIGAHLRAREAQHALAETHAAALWESTETLQSLALSLEKLAVCADRLQEVALLSEVSRAAGEVSRAMAILPMSHAAMAPTMKFVTQLADQAASLLPQTADTGLTEDARTQLRAHLALCTQLAAQLTLARDAMAEGGFTQLNATGFYDPSADSLESLADKDHGMQYPTLIYDGPFSDARHAGAPQGLPQGEVTAAQALDIARAFVGEERVLSVSPAPDAGGSIPAWGVTVVTEGLQLNLEITRQGGKVLWMMPETASFQQLQSIAVCREAAEDFLAARGFGDMEATHHQVYDGLCVLNFAAVQAGVRLYPDLVKVQVRMDTAQVVGIEANNYWMNHRRRDLPTPAVTEDSARAALLPGLTISASRLCLIPLHASEVLCWEFDAAQGDSRYLIYIDALTGQQVQLLKVIPVSQGTLVGSGSSTLFLGVFDPFLGGLRPFSWTGQPRCSPSGGHGASTVAPRRGASSTDNLT